MMSIRFIKNIHNSYRRCFSSTGKLVNISVDEDSGVSTVTMQKLPVNSLSLELLEELRDTFDSLEKSKSPGMILTSACPTVFSAGLDIQEMYKPKPERVSKFWSTLQEVWMKLYSSPYPTVAAISGHSPAGGCLLALSCEYRVMVGPKYKIGLNETQLGIVAPKWFQDSMLNVISRRSAELALTTGHMFSTEEALKVGLIDEIATDRDDAIKRANEFLEKFCNISSAARQLTKQTLRKSTVDWLLNNREQDLQSFLKFVNMPIVQTGLEMYMATLKNK